MNVQKWKGITEVAEEMIKLCRWKPDQKSRTPLQTKFYIRGCTAVHSPLNYSMPFWWHSDLTFGQVCDYICTFQMFEKPNSHELRNHKSMIWSKNYTVPSVMRVWYSFTPPYRHFLATTQNLGSLWTLTTTKAEATVHTCQKSAMTITLCLSSG